MKYDAMEPGKKGKVVSPGSGPVEYHHPCVQKLMAASGYILMKQKRPMNLPFIFGQAGGIYLVEFFWQRPGRKTDWHVIAGDFYPIPTNCNP